MADPFRTVSSSQHDHNGGLRRIRGQHVLNASFVESVPLDYYRNEIPFVEPNRTYDRDSNYQTQHEAFDDDIPTTPVQQAGPLYSGNISSVDLPRRVPAVDHPPYEDFIKVKDTQGTYSTFVWPALVICVPMILLDAALLFIVFRYMVKQVPNLFTPVSRSAFRHKGYLLVDFPATKLVFLASFLSTIAPMEAGCIMSLTAVLVYRELRRSSDVSHFPHLPTPYQMSLLIGVLAASYEQLYSCFTYLLSRKRKVKASPVLLYSMGIFLLSVLMALAVTITDAYLHIATQTTTFTLYSAPLLTDAELGRGLNSYCLGVDRVLDNFGYPCSFPTTQELAQEEGYRLGQPEHMRIAHNTSSFSAMHLAQTERTQSGSIAYLLPEASLVPEQTNYKASTIGIAAKCSLIPTQMCSITRWGDLGIYLSFNCSTQFWGTLGLPPDEADIDGGGENVSPYLSFLAIHSNTNLIYNYFADKDMETVYNTADLNASAVPDSNSQLWNDDELKNPVYLGLAWRMGLDTFPGYQQNGMISSGLVHTYENTTYVDWFLKCEVTSYDVTYAWVNQTLQTMDVVKHENGSILNIWTGTADYTPRVSDSDSDLQDYNVQSVINGNSTSSYEQKYGDLIALDALAIVGAYTSGRRTLEQQEQRITLVANVPLSALSLLLACSLLYPVLGLTLLAMARRASEETGPMPPVFSYWGLASAAFMQSPSRRNLIGLRIVDQRPSDQEEALRLFIRPEDGSGQHFGLWRRSRTGYVAEI